MKRLVALTLAILTVGLTPILIDGLNNAMSIDFVEQQIPFIIETKRMLSSGQLPLWSWNTFFGENFIGGYSFYTLTSPFVWIACLFPESQIAWGVLVSLYLKTVLTAIFTFIYLRHNRLPRSLATTGSLLYTFSSFYICNLYYYHFCEPVMIFPLLLMSIENFLDKNGRLRMFWLAVCSFAVVWINFYFAVASFLLGLFYFLFRARSLGVLSIRAVGRGATAVAIGIMASSVILLPTILNIIGTQRFNITTDTLLSANLSIADFLNRLYCLLVPTVGEGYPGSFTSNYFSSRHAFVAVIGLLPALLEIGRRRWMSLLLITLLVCYFTPLSALFSGFSSPTYMRWLYGLILIIILCDMTAINRGCSIKPRHIAVYAGICVGVYTLNAVYSYLHGTPFNLRMWFETALLALNIVGLIAWALMKFRHSALVYIVSICSCVNLLLFTALYFGQPSSDDSSRGVIATHLMHNPASRLGDGRPGGFRSDFLTSFTNDALVTNRPSISSSHSIFNRQIFQLRATVDPCPCLPTMHIDRHRPELAALMSVKDVIDYHDGDISASAYGDRLSLVETTPRADIYSFDNYIPPGFAYTHYITERELHQATDDSLNVPLMLLDNLVVNDYDVNIFDKHLSHGHISRRLSLDSLAARRRELTCRRFEMNTRGFTAMIESPDSTAIFFSVPADDGFTATIDNTPTTIYRVNLGLSSIIIPPGNHQIKFTYTPPGLVAGLILTVIALLIITLLRFKEPGSGQRG